MLIIENYSLEVSNKPLLSLVEEEICVILAYTSIEYKINEMAKRYY